MLAWLIEVFVSCFGVSENRLRAPTFSPSITSRTPAAPNRGLGQNPTRELGPGRVQQVAVQLDGFVGVASTHGASLTSRSTASTWVAIGSLEATVL